MYRRSRRQRFVLLLLVLTSITVITLDFRDQGSGVIESVRGGARDVLAPVQEGAQRVLGSVGDFFGGLAHYGQLKAENERLRRALEQSQADRARSIDAERARQSLLSLEHLDFAAPLAGVAARVIAIAPSNFQLTVEIDRGTDANVGKGMPVVTGGGLVGRVVDASRRRATVLLLSDPSFNVGVRIPSGDVGVARGGGDRQPLPVDFIDPAAQVARGDVVVTSGLQDSLFPPDIPVGRVARVQPAIGGDLQQKVSIEPLVDVHRLQFVKVLLRTPA